MQLFNKKFPGIYYRKRGRKKQIFTKSLVKGQRVYGERIVREKGIEYREWDPERSKLGAAIMKGISQTGIKEDSLILYLGSASGTTVSHLSDICREGMIFAVDLSPRVMKDFYFMMQKRKNIVAFLASANHLEKYSQIPKVDILFQDIAQRDQVRIFFKNYDKFLKKDGFGILSLKARSIDVTEKPGVIFKKVMKELNKKSVVVDYRKLSPYEKDHALFVVKKKA
jgi:fibrillarin-like pre-rRNA processing protein